MLKAIQHGCGSSLCVAGRRCYTLSTDCAEFAAGVAPVLSQPFRVEYAGDSLVETLATNVPE